MKTTLLSLITGLLSLTLASQQLKWAKMYPAFQTYSYPEQIEVSNTFHIAFSGLKAIPLNPAKNKGMFLNYMDSLGNVLWTSNFICDSSCVPAGLAFDKKGNVFVAGVFSSAVNIDGTNYTLTDSTAFVVKYSNTGVKKSMKMYPGIQLRDIAVDTLGIFVGLASIQDTATLYNQNITSIGPRNAFVFRVDSNDNMVYSKQIQGNIKPLRIEVSDNNNMFVYGQHIGNLKVDSFFVGWTADHPSHFVLKMNGDSVLNFVHTLIGDYAASTSFYVTKGERFIAAGTDGGPHGTDGSFEIFNVQGTRTMKTGFNYCSYGSPAIMSDTLEFWTFTTERKYTGYYNMPDSVWNQLSLVKINTPWQIAARDTIDIPGGCNLINADFRKNLYVSAIVAPGKTFSIQGTVLTNTSVTLYSYFVAKYSSQSITQSIQQRNNSIMAFDVYPNPAKENIYLRMGKTDVSNVTIKLCNSLGEQISFEERKIESNSVIELNTKLTTGLYFITINDGNKFQTKKLMIN